MPWQNHCHFNTLLMTLPGLKSEKGRSNRWIIEYCTIINTCVHRKNLLCYILLTNYGRLGAGCWPRYGLGTSDGTWIRARFMQMLFWTANYPQAACTHHTIDPMVAKGAQVQLRVRTEPRRGEIHIWSGFCGQGWDGEVLNDLFCITTLCVSSN